MKFTYVNATYKNVAYRNIAHVKQNAMVVKIIILTQVNEYIQRF